MKKSLLFIALFLFSGITMQAAEYKAGETVRIAKSDTTTSDLMVGARTIELEGTMLGDVFASGETVNVDGPVGDDVFAAARNVSVRGTIGGLFFGGGESVFIDGTIVDDAFIGGGRVRFTEQAHLQGNLFVGTGDFQFEGGTIEGNINGGSGRAYFNGTVNGSVKWGTGHISFGPDFKVNGEFELTLPAGMEGEEIKNMPAHVVVNYASRDYGHKIFMFFMFLIASIIFGLCYVLIFKDFSRDQLAFARQNALPGFGIGFLALIVTPVAIIILAVLLISLPIALFLLAFYLMLLYFSGIISGLVVGNEILKRSGKEQPSLVGALILGLFLLALVKLIPFIGFLILLIIVSFGMGTFIFFAWNLYKNKA